jgi:hypothetical protein
MDLRSIDEDEFLRRARASRPSALAQRYRRWEALRPEDEARLQPVGVLARPSRFYPADSRWLNDHSYPIVWEELAPFDLYTDGDADFLVYDELGGHARERRARYVDPALVS